MGEQWRWCRFCIILLLERVCKVQIDVPCKAVPIVAGIMHCNKNILSLVGIQKNA